MRHPILGHAARPLSSHSPLPSAGWRARSALRLQVRPQSLAALTLVLVALLAVALARPTVAAAGTPALSPPTFALAPNVASAPYGTAVAISGDTAAVTGHPDGRAVVFIFGRSGTGWT